MLTRLPFLEPYEKRYQEMPFRPLRVRLDLIDGAQLAGYDPINLDNLLARAVLEEATGGQTRLNSSLSYALPIPIQCLYRSGEGLPLWASTVFWPAGMPVDDVAYWHKRVQSGRWTGTKTGNFSIRPTQGRYMERRVPLPVKAACNEWYADCIGNAEEIARLLAPLSHVSKRRTNGFGAVKQWRIEEIEEFSLIRDGILLRPVPAEALDAVLPDVSFVEDPAPVGWTPPEWKPDLFRPGWWPGTKIAAKDERSA
jgi:hypothetical protein